MLEERTQPTGAYISSTTYFFVLFFYLNNYSLRDPQLHTPRFFYFCDPHSRPHFATHNRDPISRLTFATPLRDSHSRPHFATHIRDPLSRLTFATTLATPLHDSVRDHNSRLLFATPDRAPNRDSLFFVATSVVRLHH